MVCESGVIYSVHTPILVDRADSGNHRLDITNLSPTRAFGCGNYAWSLCYRVGDFDSGILTPRLIELQGLGGVATFMVIATLYYGYLFIL